MLDFFWKSKPVAPPVSLFSIEEERVRRRAACLAAKLDVDDAANKLRKFQDEHFSLNASLELVPRVRFDAVVSVEWLHAERARLIRSYGVAVDRHQEALRQNAEVAP
jgi:hypothetical protein